MATHFKQSYIDEHDYKAEASPMAAESISKLHAGEGARKFAASAKKKSTAAAPARGILIGIAIAAALVIAAGFFIIRGILGTPGQGEGDLGSDVQQDQTQQVSVSVDAQTGAVESGGIDYMGETYSLVAAEGGAAVVATDESGYQRTLFMLDGTPAGMLFYNGVLLVPENTAEGWDVISFVLGGESQAGPIVENGEAVHGQGEVTEVALEGSELVVSDSTGATTRIAL